MYEADLYPMADLARYAGMTRQNIYNILRKAGVEVHADREVEA